MMLRFSGTVRTLCDGFAVCCLTVSQVSWGPAIIFGFVSAEF